MRRHMTWSAALILTSLAGPVFGQSTTPKPEDLFAAVRPHLEAVLGGRLQRLPVFHSVTPADLAVLPDGSGRSSGRVWQFHDLDAATQGRLRTAATTAPAEPPSPLCAKGLTLFLSSRTMRPRLYAGMSRGR